MNISKNFLRILKLFYFNQRLRWHQKNYRHFPKNSYILDVGCGRGDFISLDPLRIIGYDFNFLSLKIAGERNFPNLLCGNVLQMPFRDESFNNIHCADLIEHFDIAQATTLLRELYRVLKKNGLLLISSPMPSDRFWGEPSHVRPYPPDSIISLLIENEEKGKGTSPTLDSIGRASIVRLYWRYSSLVNQPWTLYTNERRMQLKNLLNITTFLQIP